MNRRAFLQSLAVTTIASLAISKVSAQNSSAKLKIVVFWQDGFPTVDGLNLTKEILQNALKNHDLVFANETELKTKITEEIDVFVNPYGSAFPKKSWTAILNYLQTGGNFVNLGGTPFAVPVQNSKAETRTVSYHKRLGITQSFPVAGKDVAEWIDGETQLSEKPNLTNKGFTADEIYEFYLKLSNVNDFPEESGSDGRREAKVEAMFFGLDKDNLRIAAPVIQIDRLQGEFAGGCWMLANFKGKIEPQLIKNLVERASFGAINFLVKTDAASYRNNEQLNITLDFSSPSSQTRYFTGNNVVILIRDETKKVVFSRTIGVEKAPEIGNVFNEKIDVKNLKTGFYKLTINARIHSSNIKRKTSTLQNFLEETGFWITSEKSLESNDSFTADRHFLYRNGEPFPVVGTTYMSSKVARRFLLEPNPAVWDKDFAEMKAAGINMIRTGIWTGWKLYFDAKGNVREEVFRAFEAFVLTAKKYDIAVMFTFFAFMPEFFGGKNAYLDPVSIAGQKKFLSAFAARVKAAKDVLWDLINEPSFANPKHLWSCRPNYDEFEKRAWLAFLKKRHNEPDETKLADALREKWRLRDDENPFELPKMEDFDNVNILVNRRPLKALEFRFFAQETFNDWAKEMSQTLKNAGNSAQLVTVGQDEGGTNDSPSTQFHSDVLDFTGLHNWWANDDLLWDAVVTKSPEKPNLVQETGLMFYEKQDGAAWRTDETAARLLERKMALSLAANGAGFIEWIWNINPFMDNENEAAIGFHRFDGTAKKELKSFIKIAGFANENRQLFAGKRDEKTLLVIPYSYQFLPRNFAQEATRKTVRVFHYYCRHTLRAVGEYNLEAILREKEPPALILLPSVNCLNQKAWENLQALVKRGSKLAITGYFNDDEYLIDRKRMPNIVAEAVAPNENMSLNGKRFAVHFGGEKIQQVRRAANDNKVVFDFVYNKDGIFWSPVPLEIGENLAAIEAFYKMVLEKANLAPYFKLENDIPSILVRPTEFENAILYLVINESSNYEYVHITHLPTKTPIKLGMFPEEIALIFIDKKDGRILANTGAAIRP